MNKKFLLILIVSVSVTSCILVSCISISNLSPKQQWQNWMVNYSEKRSSSNGWLSLVGLFWLEEGENTLGSSLENKHQFPSKMPAKFGTINVKGDIISFTRASNDIRIDDKNLQNQLLKVNETIVSLNSYSFHIIKRDKGYAVRLHDSRSPNITHYEGAKFYPYSQNLAIPARLIKHKRPKKINVATVYGTTRESDSAGILEFEYAGKKLHLEAVSYGIEEPMALMFTDETSEETTYGAGRYLDVSWPKTGEMTIIDFNYAYNPPCAITKFATCPLPPRQNRLEVAIKAGELFSGH